MPTNPNYPVLNIAPGVHCQRLANGKTRSVKVTRDQSCYGVLVQTLDQDGRWKARGTRIDPRTIECAQVQETPECRSMLSGT